MMMMMMMMIIIIVIIMSVLTQFPLSVSLSKFDQPVFRIVTVFSTRHQHSD